MTKIVVDLNEKIEESSPEIKSPEFGEYQTKKGRSLLATIAKILVVALTLFVLVSLVSGFFYWRYLKTTPQYSLALIVEAARTDDQKTLDELINLNEIVDDFLPQVVNKAVDLYGRGVAPDIIQKVARAAAPILPVVKQRAKAELPGELREKTKPFEKVPFWMMAVGAGQYLDINYKDDKAIVKSKLKDRPLELTMRKKGERWEIIAIKDEKTAQRIAQKIGQEVLQIAKSRNARTIEDIGRRIGLKNVKDLLKQAEDIFK